MKTQIICEIASSHNGSLDLAKALIDAAAENGANIVKFQSWEAKNVPENDPDKKRYERYQFPDEWYPILIKHCQDRGVEFMTSIFNADKAKYIASLGVERAKIASISSTNTELLMQVGANFEEVIVSTAMQDKETIENLIDLLASNAQKFTIMACTANYPMDAKDANLERINALKGLLEGQEYASVGYSDHALDLDVAKAAIAMGVKYVEKHFSLSRHLPQIPHQMYKDGPLVTTHQVSIEPHELRELANWRDKVELMKGDGRFTSNEVEQAIKSRYQNRYGK